MLSQIAQGKVAHSIYSVFFSLLSTRILRWKKFRFLNCFRVLSIVAYLGLGPRHELLPCCTAHFCRAIKFGLIDRVGKIDFEIGCSLFAKYGIDGAYHINLFNFGGSAAFQTFMLVLSPKELEVYSPETPANKNCQQDIDASWQWQSQTPYSSSTVQSSGNSRDLARFTALLAFMLAISNG